MINSSNHQFPQRQSNVSNIRERTLTAVEYYNTNILPVRYSEGRPKTLVDSNRISMNEGRIGSRMQSVTNEGIYRSNSNLELLESAASESNIGVTRQRREYGSHGSINVISDKSTPVTGTSDHFFTLLQNYKAVAFSTTNETKEKENEQAETITEHRKSSIFKNSESSRENSSPKLRMKLKIWGQVKNSVPQTNSLSMDEAKINASSSVNCNNATGISATSDSEERTRRRAFAHYDYQSLTANLVCAAKLRGFLLERRRNTTTGASAAAAAMSSGVRSSTPDGENNEEDYGDGTRNELLENCPYFRNEIGGEKEREISLTRIYFPVNKKSANTFHQPALAYGTSILECPYGETLWNKNICPYRRRTNLIEYIDRGAYYYRQYFLGQEHSNYFGMDEQLGPVAISIKKEKPVHQPITTDPTHQQHLYRLIIRTSELLTLRGSIFEDSIPNSRGIGKPIAIKDILEYVVPEVQISCLKVAINTPQCEQQLLKLDEQGLSNKYKVGILYCRSGQVTEEEMYNNEESGPALKEFLGMLGEEVRLKGFEGYKGGLDTKTDSTGTHSVYARYNECEIMFHVSTMLPYTPNNRQQLLRKRHIGNDIVTIVFQEPGAPPFSPKNIRSQFQHVFIIIQVINACSDNTLYRIAVSRSRDVPIFGPPIKTDGVYKKSTTFANFLLSKIINGENAAHRSEKFVIMATRTRQEYLKDLCMNYCTQTLVESAPKFSIFPSKKKDPTRPRFSGDACQRGALCWQVIIDDCAQSSKIDCFLGISAETFILVEEASRQIVFVIPNRLILGWSTNGNALRVYYHQGECLTISMKDSGDRDEQLEVIERLRAVSNGCGALELNLNRNSMGQLGFHVQPDGVVTQVELNGPAWIAGLRQGYRLVEICKIAVATLSHDQMVDILKTSIQVTVTVIESLADYSPRRGCYSQSCKLSSINYEYKLEEPQRQFQEHSQFTTNQWQKYDKNYSSLVVSSGTGGVNKTTDMGTLTSSSSGKSSIDDRWYDTFENFRYEPSKMPVNVSSPTFKNQTKPGMHGDKRLLPRKISADNYVEHQKAEITYSSPDSFMNRLHIKENALEICEPIKNEISANAGNSRSGEEIKSKTSEMERSSEKSSIQASTSSVLSSASGSRNSSPKTTFPEVKLRSGVLRNNNSSQRHSNHYSSTLQEDLIKLIDPDNLNSPKNDNLQEDSGTYTKKKSQEPMHGQLKMSASTSALKSDLISDDMLFSKAKFSSKDKINKSDGFKLQQSFRLKTKLLDEEVITTARPVNLVSISNSSLQTSKAKDDQDWKNFVEKSSKTLTNFYEPKSTDSNGYEYVYDDLNAIEKTQTLNSGSTINTPDSLSPISHSEEESSSSSIYSAVGGNGNVAVALPELQNQVTQLSDRVLKETRRRKSLEIAVKKLTEENRRLQDESKQAVQQLKRFTDWFFQTIDKQS